jgi:hypothetical protein
MIAAVAAVLLAAVVAVGGLVLAGAATALPPGTIHGCVDQAHGRVLRHVYTLPDRGLTCPRGTFRVVWAKQGAAGPQGVPGSPGAPGPAGPRGLPGPAPSRVFCTQEPGSDVFDCGTERPAAAPRITGPDPFPAVVTFTVGEARTFTVTATGGPVPAITDGGAVLPAGLSFTDHGDGTATLAGTPAPGTAGSQTVTITALNGHAPNAVQPFTLTVNP